MKFRYGPLYLAPRKIQNRGTKSRRLCDRDVGRRDDDNDDDDGDGDGDGTQGWRSTGSD